MFSMAKRFPNSKFSLNLARDGDYLGGLSRWRGGDRNRWTGRSSWEGVERDSLWDFRHCWQDQVQMMYLSVFKVFKRHLTNGSQCWCFYFPQSWRWSCKDWVRVEICCHGLTCPCPLISFSRFGKFWNFCNGLTFLYILLSYWNDILKGYNS